MHVFIEIIISLTGLYILFSILNSALVEMCMKATNRRGLFLKEHIHNFFSKKENLISKPNIMQILGRKLKSTISVFKDRSNHEEAPFANKMYTHSLIESFKQNRRDPEYIDKRIFSQVFLELIEDVIPKPEGGVNEALNENEDLNDGLNEASHNSDKIKIQENIFELLPTNLQKTIHQLVGQTVDTVDYKLDKLQLEIENLYEAYMERVAEWYKAHMRWVLGIVGFIFALFFNLNTISFYKAFKTDGELRRQHVQLSRTISDNQESLTLDTAIVTRVLGEVMTDSINSIFTDQHKIQIADELLDAIQIDGKPVLTKESKNKLEIGFCKIFKKDQNSEYWIWGILGCILTGFALSFGSTFWFSVLKKLLGK